MTLQVLERPLPKLDADGSPFWEGTKREELLLQRCDSCEALRFFPRRQCPVCWSAAVRWEPAVGRGTIYSFAIVHRAPSAGFSHLVPYAIALVDLEEGVRMLSRLTDSDLDSVVIGADVEVRYEPVTDEVTLPLFALVPGETAS
jgi:uncharacterized OB-fold protein